MEKVSLSGQMEECMRESGNKARKVVKVNISGLMVRFMLENLKTMNAMEVELCTIQMERSLKEIGKTERKMENAVTYGQMDLDTMSSI
jgi:hypothetical protein